MHMTGSSSAASSMVTGGSAASIVESPSSLAAPSSAAGPWDAGGFLPPGHSEAEVCAAYAAAMATEPDPFTGGAAGMCDPGVLSENGVRDAVRLLNFYRWLAGLGPVGDDVNANRMAQQCSVMAAWNPAGPSAHSPSPAAVCYSTEGAQGAGTSNIAWGPGSPSGAVDQFMQDWGNENTMGHRRWLLYPPLQPVGVGFYRGGNNYGSAACMQVLNFGGSGPHPEYVSWPPPGFVPAGLTSWQWTFHSSMVPLGGITGDVTRLSDGVQLPITVQWMEGSYGESTISLLRDGWSPEAGQVYRVTLRPPEGTPVVYDVNPVNCP